jgi:hypothetical protein
MDKQFSLIIVSEAARTNQAVDLERKESPEGRFVSGVSVAILNRFKKLPGKPGRNESDFPGPHSTGGHSFSNGICLLGAAFGVAAVDLIGPGEIRSHGGLAKSASGQCSH